MEWTKKNIAITAAVVILILSITIAVFSLGNEEPTTNPSISHNPPVVSGSDASSSSQPAETTAAPSPQNVTYVLTTSPDKTVPWSETTRFEIDSMSSYLTTGNTLPTGSVNVNPTVGPIDKPPVNISPIPSGSDESSSSSTTKPTTTKSTAPKTTDPTAANKTPTQLIINDTSYNSSTSLITLAVADEGWKSDFTKKSQNIKIIVDGEELATTVACTVTGKVNADGCQLITIDLSSQGLNAGSNVTFTIPTGLVQTKAANQYNTSYTGYVVL